MAHIGRTPDHGLPAGTYAREVIERLIIDLTYNSSRLEGNTYSLLETQRLLELGQSADGKDLFETQMILNHKAAIEMLVEGAAEIGFDRHTIFSLHANLSDGLLADPSAGGRLRNRGVGIHGSLFLPLQVPQQIEECFDQILATVNAIQDPFEQAFFVMVHLPYLQPFEDVNKRVSRLAANIPLIQLNLCPLSFIDVPERDYIDGLLAIYEFNDVSILRDVFVWAYERSCQAYQAVRQSLGEPDPFRLRHRSSIFKSVAAVIQQNMNKSEAASFLQLESEALPVEDRERWLKLINVELNALHSGNFAKFRVTPLEFQRWQQTWN
ncbi:Fic family protein [bacterium]|nr:MAG: Fic family protein [bacterium]